MLERAGLWAGLLSSVSEIPPAAERPCRKIDGLCKQMGSHADVDASLRRGYGYRRLPSEVMQLVGIVLVSHSDRLAAGLRDLLLQIAGDDVRIEVAGGTDEGGLGTSAAKFEQAVERADTGAGVLVLADLGSAVLTARAVLDDHADRNVILADAPFVEGAVAAAVLAATGADLATVSATAQEARHATKF